MPRKAKKKNMKTSKRMYKKKQSGPQQHARLNDYITTERLSTKLQYVDVDTPVISTGASAYNFAFYKANSVYDFNANVGSTSIAGFNEWGNFYNYYKVNGLRYKMNFVNQTATPVHVVVFPSLGTFAPTASWLNFYKQMGNPNTRNVLLGGNAGNNTGVLTGYISFKNLFGKKNTYDSDTTYQGTWASDPGSIIYLYVVVLGQDPTTTTNIVACQPDFTIYTDFYTRKNLTA